MKKLLWILALALLLTACGGEEAPKPSDQPAAAIQTEAPERIDKVIGENHQIHARVYHPGGSCKLYRVEPVAMELEELCQILLPGDNSAHTVAHGEFDDRLITQSGYTIQTFEGGISLFHNAGIKKFDEIETLCERYSEEKEAPDDLDFMTLEEAIALGEETARALGINLELVTTTAVGLNHETLTGYQQELLQRDQTMDFPDYDPFGNVYRMEGLTREDDSYFISFRAAVDGIPVYGYPLEATIHAKDGVYVPAATEISMLITRNGLTLLEAVNAWVIGETEETVTVISPAEALEVYEDKWSLNLMPDSSLEVQHIYLEYVARKEGETTLLTPYWVISGSSEYLDTATGEMKVWPYQDADRFQAVTGEDITYGG